MDITQRFLDGADPGKAEKMAAYMKNRFHFLGLPGPVRKELQRDILRDKTREPSVDWEWVRWLYSFPQREFHYLAVDYLRKTVRKMQPDDLSQLRSLIQTHSWWDTVDLLAGVVGELVRRYPDLKESRVKSWISDEDFWIRRVSVLFQLKFRNQTDTQFLSMAIAGNLGSSEFFINKAIGWALREYSKTDAEWVVEFIENHELSNLSRREASKYL